MSVTRRKKVDTVDPMAVVTRFIDAANHHDVDALRACVHREFESVQPIHPGRNFRGPGQLISNWRAIFEAEPGFRLSVRRASVTEDTVWVEVHGAGASAEAAGIFIVGIEDGRIRWIRVYSDLVEPVPELPEPEPVVAPVMQDEAETAPVEEDLDDGAPLFHLVGDADAGGVADGDVDEAGDAEPAWALTLVPPREAEPEAEAAPDDAGVGAESAPGLAADSSGDPAGVVEDAGAEAAESIWAERPDDVAVVPETTGASVALETPAGEAPLGDETLVPTAETPDADSPDADSPDADSPDADSPDADSPDRVTVDDSWASASPPVAVEPAPETSAEERPPRSSPPTTTPLGERAPWRRWRRGRGD